MKVADAVRACASCPRCGARVDTRCQTKTGRNHVERVRAALVEAIAHEAELRSEPTLARDIRRRHGGQTS